jgi:hypothetical protein
LVGATVTAGSSVVLSGSASGGGQVTYQWRRNGKAIAGGTSQVLKLEEVGVGDGGRYELVAMNPRNTLSCGSVDVTVAEADVIVTQPEREKRVSEGAEVLLSVVAAGKTL